MPLTALHLFLSQLSQKGWRQVRRQVLLGGLKRVDLTLVLKLCSPGPANSFAPQPHKSWLMNYNRFNLNISRISSHFPLKKVTLFPPSVPNLKTSFKVHIITGKNSSPLRKKSAKASLTNYAGKTTEFHNYFSPQILLPLADYRWHALPVGNLAQPPGQSINILDRLFANKWIWESESQLYELCWPLNIFSLSPGSDDFGVEQRDWGCCEMKGTMASGTAGRKRMLATILCSKLLPCLR